jgi:hypothetical protein
LPLIVIRGVAGAAHFRPIHTNSRLPAASPELSAATLEAGPDLVATPTTAMIIAACRSAF